MIKRIVERLSRNRKLRRTLPNGVAFYVTPDSQLKYLKKRFDMDLVELAATRVDSQSAVWDIGANCGVFAFSCAHARQVIAVEADPFLCNLLQQSVTMNGIPVAVVAAAAYSSATLLEFSIASRGRASNFLSSFGGRNQSGGERGRLWVPTISLDDLLDHFLPPTFVKIDVEGAETEVLRGATNLLRKVRPVLYLEIGPDALANCCKLLESVDYRLRRGAELNWLAEPN
jgi:FkbM family methyltransferase